MKTTDKKKELPPIVTRPPFDLQHMLRQVEGIRQYLNRLYAQKKPK